MSVRTNDEALVVFERGGEVIAWMEIHRRHAMESGAWGEIVGMVVDEASRGQGVGKLLVEWGKRWTQERGLARLRVRTNEKRIDTARFYEAQGFSLTKVHRVYDMPVRGLEE